MKKNCKEVFRPRLSQKTRQILSKGGAQTSKRGARGYDRRRDKKIIQKRTLIGEE
jgi:hypothetical protein